MQFINFVTVPFCVSSDRACKKKLKLIEKENYHTKVHPKIRRDFNLAMLFNVIYLLNLVDIFK